MSPTRRQMTCGGGLHRYALLCAAATFVLIIAGGLVTSTGSGLAVPDWPLSYGMLFPPMVGGILYEHGHRMIAGTVALMTVGLAVWLWRRESRAWVRRLGFAAVATVLVQALLGGITVLWLLPPAVSTAHLGTAMLFFSLVVAIAAVTAPGWHRVSPPAERASPVASLALWTTAAVYVQILLGAAMRHTQAGLACPDFPRCRGRWLPWPDDGAMALHLAHRGWAIVVVILVVLLAERTWRHHGGVAPLRRPALAAVVLVCVQLLLGALSVLSGLAVEMTVAHVAGGAALLGSLVVFTLRLWRHVLGWRAEEAVAAPGAAT